MLELSALDAVDYTIERSFPSEGCEFYVTLRRGRHDQGGEQDLQTRRLELQRQTLTELYEQANMLTDEVAHDEREAALQAQLAAAIDELAAARATVSWRVTRPLRRIRRLF